MDAGFITKITKVREYDMLVQVFTKDKGSNGYYLNNANRPNSRRRQSLEILNLIQFSETKQRKSSDLYSMGELKLLSNFSNIKSPTQLYAEAFLLAETLNKFLPAAEPQQDVFRLLLEVADYRSDSETHSLPEKAFIYITLKSLEILGFMPELNLCQKTGETLTASDNIQPFGDGGIGYYKSGLDEIGGSKLVMQGVKVQSYILNPNTTFADLFKLKLSDRLLIHLRDLQISWIEFIIDSKLKSKSLLNNAR